MQTGEHRRTLRESVDFANGRAWTSWAAINSCCVGACNWVLLTMLGIGRTLVSMTFARIVLGFANDELQNLRNKNLRVTENLRAQSWRLGDHAWRAWTSWAAINSCCVGAVVQLSALDDVGDPIGLVGRSRR